MPNPSASLYSSNKEQQWLTTVEFVTDFQYNVEVVQKQSSHYQLQGGFKPWSPDESPLAVIYHGMVWMECAVSLLSSGYEYAKKSILYTQSFLAFGTERLHEPLPHTLNILKLVL